MTKRKFSAKQIAAQKAFAKRFGGKKAARVAKSAARKGAIAAAKATPHFADWGGKVQEKQLQVVTTPARIAADRIGVGGLARVASRVQRAQLRLATAPARFVAKLVPKYVPKFLRKR